MHPAEFDTVLTTMMKVKELTEDNGQLFSVITFDQQLYNIAIQIQWSMLDTFPFDSFFIRLGGMHTLMNFIGAIGYLMADSGLSDILSPVFSGVEKMLKGQKFPQCLRALRIVVEVILEPLLEQEGVTCHADLIRELEERAKECQTCKLWLDCLVKPVFLAMDFIRAERESDFPLHVACLKAMHSYFFAAGRVNYSRAVASYLMNIEILPANIIKGFLEGNHVMRHQRGIWNGISSDMFIESTFMRYGHSRTGVIGLTLKPETLKVWALSRHICSKMLLQLEDVRGSGNGEIHTKHKEEYPSRQISDKSDRAGIRAKIAKCIHPFIPSKHPAELVNVHSGRLAPSTVNVQDTVGIAKKQASAFQESLPEGYWHSIPRQIKNLSESKKHFKSTQGVQLYDTELIYSRAMALQSTTRNIDAKTLLSHELAPIPMSMFESSGEMRLCSTKSDLKSDTQVTQSERTTENIDCLILDGCAILWVVQWPSSSLHQEAQVKDFVDSFESYILHRLETADVYLVFDRYLDYSTKSSTRSARGANGCKVFQLSYLSPIPSQTQVLNSPQNKKQLIAIIVEKLVKQLDQHPHKLVITGQDPCPVEIFHGICIQRHDLSTNHEEADVIVASQAIYAAEVEKKTVGVMADDTDIYILLLFHFMKQHLTSRMLMIPTKQGRAVVDIKLTAERLGDMCSELMPAHALTGCDQVPTYYGIGKKTC